jgi:hypothetical protein
MRGKKNRTTHPKGRAHQPSGVSVIVTQITRRRPSSDTSVVVFMCSVSHRGVDVRLQLVAVLNADVLLRDFKALVSQPCLNGA